MTVMPIAEKFEAFGWNVIKIDGHDMAQILDAFKQAREVKGKPTMIVAETIKGKDVSFMEGHPEFHHRRLSQAEYDQARAEILGDVIGDDISPEDKKKKEEVL